MHFEQFLSIDEWCALRRVSRAQYYRLRRSGDSPEAIYIRGKPIITAEADEKWQAKMMAESRRNRESREAESMKYSRRHGGRS